MEQSYNFVVVVAVPRARVCHACFRASFTNGSLSSKFWPGVMHESNYRSRGSVARDIKAAGCKLTKAPLPRQR